MTGRLTITRAPPHSDNAEGTERVPAGALPVGTVVDVNKLKDVEGVQVEILSRDPGVIRDVIPQIHAMRGTAMARVNMNRRGWIDSTLMAFLVLVLCVGCTAPSGDPLKHTKTLVLEGHRSLYNNGAFQVPNTSIRLIPAGPSALELDGIDRDSGQAVLSPVAQESA